MQIEEKELTRSQAGVLGQAKAVTEAQFQLARDIARSEFGTESATLDAEMLLKIVQILATNYLASVNRAN